ncbi:iron donor protein CyaY [Buchnera aphidicola]|uniref:iron donor protein CyaY n=1 Tax=Buchnera aphidicola TaxID=9 RepID=UPI0031B88802
MKIDIFKFHKIVDKLMIHIEDTIYKNFDTQDIDCEIQYRTMILTFLNKNQIIINRQESLRQIWLATQYNGYHFIYYNLQWICNKSRDNFFNILAKSCTIETNKIIYF